MRWIVWLIAETWFQLRVQNRAGVKSRMRNNANMPPARRRGGPRGWQK